uniref:Ig-like domain-containing protein n=1 Tax=Haplochromis burtoni TaxID=8153 RepID=A0A3Q3BKY9_HAPBU
MASLYKLQLKLNNIFVTVLSVSAPLFPSVSAAGSFIVNVTQTSYQAEENHNITLEWTFTTKPDSKYIFINCDQKSSGKVHEIFSNKIQYHIRDVVEVSVSQDERFLGRVQSDKDALREGRIKLQLSRLRTEDSGMYTCHVKTDYGSGSASSELEVTSNFAAQITFAAFSLFQFLVCLLLSFPLCVLNRIICSECDTDLLSGRGEPQHHTGVDVHHHT